MYHTAFKEQEAGQSVLWSENCLQGTHLPEHGVSGTIETLGNKSIKGSGVTETERTSLGGLRCM